MSNTRASARRKSKTPLVGSTVTGPFQATQGGSNSKDERLPPNKKRKKQCKTEKTQAADARVKGKRGKLQIMTEMPVDVLLEIFKFVNPVDVLHLSWTTKFLHSVLMRPSSQPVWESCYINMDDPPPPCPEDLNLIQYTKLIWGKLCYHCESTNGSVILWADRSRACANCLEGRSGLFAKSGSNGANEFSHLAVSINAIFHNKEVTFYKIQDVVNGRQRFREAQKGFATSQEFHQELQRTRLKQMKDDQNFIGWLKRAKRSHDRQLQQVVEERKAAIMIKLNALGWEDEIARLSQTEINLLPGTKISKPLTENEWARISTKLIEQLESIRRKRLGKERRKVIGERLVAFQSAYGQFIRSKPGDEPTMACWSDITILEPIRSLIYGTPLDKTLSVGDFNDMEMLQSAIEDWTASCDEYLASLVDDSQSTERLHLATTFFVCKHCKSKDPISYPRILAHACLRPTNSANNRQTNDEPEIELMSQSAPRPWIYGRGGVTFGEKLSRQARRIIQACGRGPEVTSMQEMDELDPYIECIQCRDPSRGQLVMKWKTAILHQIEAHTKMREDQIEWRMLSPEQLQLVSAQEEKNAGNWRWPFVTCKSCSENVESSPELLRAHLHSHMNPVDGTYAEALQQFHLSVDSPMKRPPYAVRIK